MTERPRVVLADDHGPTRAGVRAVLRGDGFDVCAEAADAESAVAAVVRFRPDLCVLDVEMPGGGIAAAAAIRAQAPEVTVVMLTESDAEQDLLDAVRAGARGFLHKEMNADRLGTALRGALDGEAAIPRRLVGSLVDAVAAGPSGAPRRSPRFDLTEREWEVLDLLVDDVSTKQIAQRLGVADVTVRRHISHLVQKLGVADREAAVRKVLGG